ncbi:hypothetical protein E0W69_009025 [Rhizosphaericola mali]|uniref:Uncharacterized protein n=1 Tax=Rhizosphaericola mali TaxID=2545455 RepID=A0A5P2G0S7_9BACT|nr:hypothetical protein E0W69_009025 [Rhizosphaericola mali]
MRSTRSSDLSNEQIAKRRNILKGVVVGFCTMAVVAIDNIVHLSAIRVLENVSIATLIPILALPTTLILALSSMVTTNKKIKACGTISHLFFVSTKAKTFG